MLHQQWVSLALVVHLDYDNGSKSKGMRRGKNGNIGIVGSSSTFGCSHPDAYYDNGICGGTNVNETETSQHARGSQQTIPNHPSQRPMITLYYGGAIAHLPGTYTLTGSSAMYSALEKVNINVGINAERKLGYGDRILHMGNGAQQLLKPYERMEIVLESDLISKNSVGEIAGGSLSCLCCKVHKARCEFAQIDLVSRFINRIRGSSSGLIVEHILRAVNEEQRKQNLPLRCIATQSASTWGVRSCMESSLD
ncbi:hypothetical protein Tco_0804513 [Tanacetum coccineum]|uniref:Uncharacterized protein n=1 Tax=Tanacetum coccineum TaxID=301880 RepID=A0ABQ5A4I1_9ASTR